MVGAPNLLSELEVIQAAAVSGAATVVYSNYTIPTGGGVVEVAWFIEFGAITAANGTPSVKVYEAASSDYSDKVEIPACAVSLGTSNAFANKQVTVGVVRPTEGYLQLVIDRTGSSNSIAVSNICTIAKHSHKLPDPAVTNNSARKIGLGGKYT